MTDNPKVSIITVAYNSQSTIKHTVESVNAQNYANKEYIIVDGGSTDWTLDILNTCKDRIDFMISEKDRGIYDAMNKGILASTGDIIGILNSDDFYADNLVLSKVVKAFKESKCDCLYGDLVYVSRADASKVVRYWESGNFDITKLNNGWMLPHPTFFVRKSIYDKYGLYNTELESAADYEMILRLLHKHKINVSYMSEIMIKMRMGGKSNRSLWNRLKANNEDALAWSENKLPKPSFIRFKKPFKKIKQFFVKPKFFEDINN